MHLRDFVDPALIFTGLTSSDKSSLLEELATRTAEQLPDVKRAALLESLLARESESSTGVGQGVAIPHCFLDGLEASRCILAQVPQGIAYDAIDGEPVYVLFILLSPPKDQMAHLRLLARISRVANREGFAADVSAATSADALHALIEQEDRAHSG